MSYLHHPFSHLLKLEPAHEGQATSTASRDVVLPPDSRPVCRYDTPPICGLSIHQPKQHTRRGKNDKSVLAECAPLAQLAGKPHPPPVSLDYLPRNGQSKSQTGGGMLLVLDPVVGLEKPLVLLFSIARPCFSRPPLTRDSTSSMFKGLVM